MLKVDIITMSGTKNYGSALQTFATQEFFKKHGFLPRFINYVRPDSLYENLLDSWCGKNFLKRLAMYPTIKRWSKIFEKFYRNVHFTDEVYSYPNDFISFKSDADLFCTGSDQVWNSIRNRGVIKSMYFDFLSNDEYLFSFGASFGQSRLDNEEIYQTNELIHRYKKISVREDNALRILNEQYKYKNAIQIIDPTLCLDRVFWKSLIDKPIVKGNYILIYNLNRSKKFDDYGRKLGKKSGFKVYRLCTRYDQMFRYGKPILVPEVLDFVNLIANAKYVLTDSFHATAFSLNLNVEPICIYPDNFGGRLKSILKLTKCEYRHVSDFNDFDVLNRHIDFKQVNEILDRERDKASQFLNDVIADYFKKGD